MYITLWVAKELFEQVSDIRFDKTISQQGILNITKGTCLSLRFKILEKSFCFVNSQLSSGISKTKIRNQQYNDFIEKIDFGEGLNIIDHW